MYRTPMILFLLFTMTATQQSLFAEIKDRSFYYGVWIDSAQYHEMHRTKSLHGSREYVLNQHVLHYRPDTSRLFGVSDGLDYVDSAFENNTLILKCIGNDDYLLTLRILDDSTLYCGHFLGDSSLVFRRMVPAPPQYCIPIEWSFTRKYFEGQKLLTSIETGVTSRIALQNDGEVEGSSEFTRFVVNMGGWEGLPPYDLLWLQGQDTCSVGYAFTVESDSILVYELDASKGSLKSAFTNCSGEYDKVVRGQLKYSIKPALSY